MSVKPNSIRAWCLAARPKTLTGALVPVVMALALSVRDGAVCHPWAMLACAVFAALMQVAANFINDLYDFLKGTDRADRLGPERACAQGWISPRAMKWGIGVVLVLACGVGLTLLCFGNPLILISIGLACVVGAFLYTTLLSYQGGGDLMVFLFFGLVPVGGTYYVVTECCTPNALLLGTVAGVLIDTLLVINNYRDRDTDRRDGKRTLVARWGEPFGRYFYLALGLLAVALSLFLLSGSPWWAPLLHLPYVALHVTTWHRMSAIRQGRALNAILGETSRNMMVFALLLSVALIL